MRIPPVEEKEAAPEVAQLYAEAKRLRGVLSSFYRVVAHSPRVLEALIPFNNVLHGERGGSHLDARIQELVILRTSMLNGCAYCIGHNTEIAQAIGISEHELQELATGKCESCGSFSSSEKAAIRWAERVTNLQARGDDEAFGVLKTYFTLPEIIEITMLCGMFNMFNRFMEALHVPLDSPGGRDISCVIDTSRGVSRRVSSSVL